MFVSVFPSHLISSHPYSSKPPAASKPPSIMEIKGFGAPVTHETLKEMGHYSGKTITRFHKGQEALKDMYGEDKEVALLEHAKELIPKIGDKSATICMVYNATGEPLEYVTHHDWSGVLQGSSHYPKEIPNGQWAAFVHASSHLSFGLLLPPSSDGAVVYRCKNASGAQSDWMFSWINSYSSEHERTAYTEIQKAGYFDGENEYLWEEIGEKSMDSKTESSDERNELLAKVYIQPEPVAVYRAVLFHEGADKPYSYSAASKPPSVIETKGFGAPVTHETLKAMSHYSGKTITRFHKAQEALKDMHGEGKEVALLQHVKELIPKIGDKATTICMVYNATGEPLEYVAHHNWSGVLQGSTHYPEEIPNGQWAAFVHASKVAAIRTSSSGAVVYRCKNASGAESDWMFSWNSTSSTQHGHTMRTAEATAHQEYLANQERMLLLERELQRAQAEIQRRERAAETQTQELEELKRRVEDKIQNNEATLRRLQTLLRVNKCMLCISCLSIAALIIKKVKQTT